MNQGLSTISQNHWVLEDYSECMATLVWRRWLLDHGDTIIVKGRLRHLRAKPMGGAVVKVSKIPLTEEETA